MSTTPPTSPQDPDGSAADATNDADAAGSTPTEAYPPADSTPAPAPPAATGGYGDAYVAPTAPPLPPVPPAPPSGAAYGAPPAPYGAPPSPYGTPTAAYGAPTAPYGTPSAAPAPDTRSKAVAWTALGLAAGGTLLSIVGIVPVPWLGLVAVLIGGLLLLAGFVFSIVGLAGKRHGGKPLSITALVLSLVGATIGSFALIWSIILVGVTSAGSTIDEMMSTPSPVPSVEVTPGGVLPGEEDDTATAAESASEVAFIADVRPKVNQILGEVDPTATPDVIEQVLPDQSLILIGQTLLVTGEAGIEDLVQQTITSVGADESSADLLRTLYGEILGSARTYLQ